MPDKDCQNPGMRLPQGFTIYSSKRSSEFAREQGWGINEEERTKTAQQKQEYDGGLGYAYGAGPSGDTSMHPGRTELPVERSKTRPIRQKKPAA